jgi:hypothetical protein
VGGESCLVGSNPTLSAVAFTRKTLIFAMFVVALTGCGGNSDAPTEAGTTSAGTTATSSTATTDSADATQAVPQAAQPVTELIPALERLGAQGDCADAVKLINPSDLVEPDRGANEANCQAIQGTLDRLDGFKADESAEFGTAAIIDGSARGDEFAVVAALDQTKSFKLLGIYFRRPQIGTEPAPAVDFEAPAAAFVKALRDDDCTSARAALSPISRLEYANLKQFCSVFEDNFMADPDGLGARLQADPAADLVDLGGTSNVHVFGLATEPAGYRTIIVGTIEGGEPRISDVVPVER